MSYNKRRFAIITAAYIILCLLYFFLPVVAGAMSRRILKGIPLAFLFVCGCIPDRKHPLALTAIFFSMLGDYAGEFSVPGIATLDMMIIFFGIAQIFYILEFRRYLRPVTARPSGRTYAMFPIACVIYAILLTGNVVHSCLQHRDRKWMFVTGSLLFLISDSMILYRGLFPAPEFVGPAIMITYFMAQYLLNINVLACSERN